jgi:hypothetical protein
MDFAMDNLGQLTILLESKSIERLWFCQIHHNDDKLTNNLRKTSKRIGLTISRSVLYRADKVIK